MTKQGLQPVKLVLFYLITLCESRCFKMCLCFIYTRCTRHSHTNRDQYQSLLSPAMSVKLWCPSTPGSSREWASDSRKVLRMRSHALKRVA